tara:strand:+ start:79 stop:582 length:504 start_codon:yes stop_codon:yes gene_type:complete
MSIRKTFTLLVSHGIAVAVGFAVGIYTLPIIVAADAPSASAVSALADKAQYSAEFRRELKDSDALHWGEGQVFVGRDSISFMGRLAPGPDYMLYLSPTFVETETEFNRLKSKMVVVGSVKTFDNFLVEIPPGIEPSDYTTVIVWCESFGEFITSAKYQNELKGDATL